MRKRELQKLHEYIRELPVFSTHEHFRDTGDGGTCTVDTLIRNSYLDEEWVCTTPGTGRESRAAFLRDLGSKSYLVWFKKSLKAVYRMSEELSADTWEAYDNAIGKTRNRNFLAAVYRNYCGYTGVIQDSFWNPGEIPTDFPMFRPTFRINSFLYGYRKKTADHNGNSPRVLYGIETYDIDEYVQSMETVIAGKLKAGAVALKSALAYDRTIAFRDPGASKAQKALKKKTRPDEEAIRDFGDYIFNRICEIAEKYAVPFQIHTGLGLLDCSDPMLMESVIRRFPGVRFVLFHGGFPWIDSIGGLLHNYPNVYADLVWLPLISPTAASLALHQWLEVAVSSDRIAWGSDCKTPEESYGAVLAFRQVLFTVLSQKMETGYFGLETASDIARRVAHANGEALYAKPHTTGTDCARDKRTGI